MERSCCTLSTTHCAKIVCTIIQNKNLHTAIKAISKIWISVYGSAEKSFTNNEGEFANLDFKQSCKHFGKTVKPYQP